MPKGIAHFQRNSKMASLHFRIWRQSHSVPLPRREHAIFSPSIPRQYYPSFVPFLPARFADSRISFPRSLSKHRLFPPPLYLGVAVKRENGGKRISPTPFYFSSGIRGEDNTLSKYLYVHTYIPHYNVISSSVDPTHRHIFCIGFIPMGERKIVNVKLVII